jgi:protein-S-isoprenylcysteine O-methyltransferase Ste14
MHIDPFIVRGIVSNLFFALILIACLFLPAGSWNYWQAWVFLVLFELCAQAFGIYFLINDRKVIERRVRVGPTAEREPAQKIISALIIATFIAAFIVPAFDHRFGWSPVAPAVSILGDALVAFSFLIFFFVLQANSYAASTIQVEEGQPVISSGPYALVRHPMYSGTLVLIVAIPLALGSWWGVLLLVPFLPVLLWRLLYEERFLRKNLPGYAAYTQQVRYRLIPAIF